jgi:hypothetical protein
VIPPVEIPFQVGTSLTCKGSDPSGFEAAGLIGRNPGNSDRTVLEEMPRMALEQFIWLREFFHSQRMHLYYFIYGQGSCAAYFEQKYGLPIDQFALNCVALYSYAQTTGWHLRPRLPEPAAGQHGPDH